jgi:hypothetical protein
MTTKNPQHGKQHENGDSTPETATEEVVRELEELSEEDETEDRPEEEVGIGDPLRPSTEANRKAFQRNPSD